eukprot:8184966-Alexandrium_andersonii.AAC.1
MLAGCAAGTSFPQLCLASVGSLGAGGTKGGTSCLLACLPLCGSSEARKLGSSEARKLGSCS